MGWPLLALTGGSPFTLSGEHFFVSPYSIAGKRFLFVINSTEEDREITVSGPCEVYFPETDTWTEKPEKFVLPAERGAFVFEE